LGDVGAHDEPGMRRLQDSITSCLIQTFTTASRAMSALHNFEKSVSYLTLAVNASAPAPPLFHVTMAVSTMDLARALTMTDGEDSDKAKRLFRLATQLDSTIRNATTAIDQLSVHALQAQTLTVLAEMVQHNKSLRLDVGNQSHADLFVKAEQAHYNSVTQLQQARGAHMHFSVQETAMLSTAFAEYARFCLDRLESSTGKDDRSRGIVLIQPRGVLDFLERILYHCRRSFGLSVSTLPLAFFPPSCVYKTQDSVLNKTRSMQ
jgi:hypothetical protein